MIHRETLGPLSLLETRAILGTIGATPTKILGQNFLVDKNIVWKSLKLAQVSEGDRIVEIGPGLGTLTRALLSKKCNVWAVEFDSGLYRYLSETFTDVENFHILHGDAVQFPLACIPDPLQPFKIVANLPYNISTPWLDAVLSQAENIAYFENVMPSSTINVVPNEKMRLSYGLSETMTLMLQAEAAARIMAPCGTKHFSALSIALQAQYSQDEKVPVSRTSFFPPPKVDSVILHLIRRSDGFLFHPVMRSMMRKIFTQRRKQIGRIVRTFFPKQWDNLLEILEKNGCHVSARPEELPITFWKDWNHTVCEESAKKIEFC